MKAAREWNEAKSYLTPMLASAAAVLPDLFHRREVIPKAGTPIAYDESADGETVWRTPYDDCVLVMPSLRHKKAGTPMVRLGRYA